MLTAASVLGVDFYEDVLIDMVGLPEPVVIDTLDAAARGGLLIDAGSVRRSLRFVHALVANALVRRCRPLSTRSPARARGPCIGEERRGVAAERGRPARASLRARRVGRPRPNAGRLAPAITRSITSHPPRRRSTTASRSTSRSRSIDPTPSAPTCSCGSETRSTAPATRRRSTRSTKARGSRSAAARDEALVRAAFAADRGFMRLDNRAPEYLATVEAALAVTDPADVATYARLRALLAQSLMYTPDAARRLAAAHEALDLATEHGDPTAARPGRAGGALRAVGTRTPRAARCASRRGAIRAAEGTRRPEARVQRAPLGVQHGRGVGRSCGRGAQPRPDARDRTRDRRTAVALDGGPLRHVRRDDGRPARRGRGARRPRTSTSACRSPRPTRSPSSPARSSSSARSRGRHEELLPLVEQAANDNPGVVPFKLAYGIICAAVGRDDVARDILSEGVATRFSEIAVDNLWMTSVIGYAVLAIELGDAEAAAHLLPLIEPFAAEVAFNGVDEPRPGRRVRRQARVAARSSTRSRRSTCSPRSTPRPRSAGTTTAPRRCSRSRRTGYRRNGALDRECRDVARRSVGAVPGRRLPELDPADRRARRRQPSVST